MKHIRIVDAQVHIWAPNTIERPWLPPSPRIPLPHKPLPFTKDDLLLQMDEAGVDAALLVTPMWEGARNDIVLAAARAHPDRFAVIGRLDLQSPDAHGLVTTWRTVRGMLGLRALCHPNERALLVEGHIDWLWPQAEKAGVPIVLYVAHPDLRFIDLIAARHPELKLVIDHLGIPIHSRDEDAFRELDQLLVLGRRPNVAVKATCLQHHTSDAYPYRALHEPVRRVYDAFGSRRIFWGSDLTRLTCSYRQAVTMFTEEMPWLNADDKEWIMGRALCEWFGWRRNAPPVSSANG